jgi:hypothetical protein
MTAPILAWQAPEHSHTDKTNDWYWSVGIIAVTASAIAFIFSSTVFGIFILVAAFALMIKVGNPPENMNYEINDRGIVVGNILYPFLTLESFWIDHEEVEPRILIKSRKMLMPYISIPIAKGVDPENVRTVLLEYIAETEHREPLTQKILERLGF